MLKLIFRRLLEAIPTLLVLITAYSGVIEW